MAVTVGSNIASLRAQRQLNRSSNSLSSVFERLSSGQRINRASDDAAGLAISESLNVDRKVYTQGMRNLNDGISLLNIADSAIAELSSIVIRIQELAEQAANGSLSHTQRDSLDSEAQQLKDEYFRISRSTDFNNLNLFDGSIEQGVRIQGGYGIDGSISSSLGGAMGDGTLQATNTLSRGNGGGESELRDIDGDGVLDLIATGYAYSTGTNGTITVSLGNGDGTFGAMERLARMFPLAQVRLFPSLTLTTTESSMLLQATSVMSQSYLEMETEPSEQS